MDSIQQKISKEDLQQAYFMNDAFKHTGIKVCRGLGIADFDDTAIEVAKMSGPLQNMEFDKT